MNIHLLICFIMHLHKKVHLKISSQLSGSVFSFQEYIYRIRNIGDPHVYFSCSFSSLSEMLITLMLNLLCHKTHVYSFLCAIEGGIQSAFRNRLVALFLFNCPFQLSYLRMESEKEITSEFKRNNRSQYSYSCVSHTSS